LCIGYVVKIAPKSIKVATFRDRVKEGAVAPTKTLRLRSTKFVQKRGEDLMKRAERIVLGLLFLAAILPNAALAGLSAQNVDFGSVREGVSVTKSVTVSNSTPGFHYLLDPSGAGATVTVAPGTCPSGAASGTVGSCQVQVTVPAGTELGSGSDTASIAYKSDDMPFQSDDAGLTISSLMISVTYTVIAKADSDVDGVPDSTPDLCPNTPAGESVDITGCSESQSLYDVTATAGANGKITPDGLRQTTEGGRLSYALTPDAGFTASVGGTCGGSLSGNFYTTNSITADCTVVATFSATTVNIVATAGPNGSISPSGSQAVTPGAIASFTVTADLGFTPTVAGTCGGSLDGSVYTTNSVTEDCTVNAEFSTQANPAEDDDDNDGVVNSLDKCPNTPSGEPVDASGCSASQLETDTNTDTDGDGVADNVDQCPNTPPGEAVNSSGCSASQLDTDGDGVSDDIDQCPKTPAGESVDAEGCAQSERDDDGDGVANDIDQCPNTPPGVAVDSQGCSKTEQDDDGDGVANDADQCPNTPAEESVNASGCSASQIDTDGDGVSDDVDECPSTPAGESVNASGCSASQIDTDGDGVSDDVDECPSTPAGELVNASGCSASQIDTDGDGVSDDVDQCPNTPAGESVDASGCAQSETDDDGDGVANDLDQCPNTPAGESVNASGCGASQLDDDGDGIANDIDQCPNTPPGETVDAQGCSQGEKDSDGDGVANDIDECPNTPPGTQVDETGCPTKEQVLDSLLDAAGGDDQLGATSEAISDACTSDELSGQLLADCQALIGASIEKESGVNQALNEITPERAVQANAQVQRANTVQDQNIGNRIAALRAGARGISVDGLSFSNGESRLNGGHLASAVDDILMPASGASSDEEPMLLANSRWGVFLSGELSKAERDESTNSSAFKMDTTVLSGGLDYRVSDNFVLGGAVSFTDGETRLADDKGNLDARGTSLSLYGSLYSERLYLDFSATYGDSEFDQSRRLGYVLGNGTQVKQSMRAEYDGETTSVHLGVGWDAIQTAWIVTLRASLDYLDSEIDPFTEQASDTNGSGAGWAVAIDGQSQDWLTGRLTGSVSRVVSASWGVIIPYVEFDVVQEFANDAAFITGNFAADLDGSKLIIAVDEPDKSYYRGRFGASVQLPGGFAGFVDYGRLFAYDRWSEYTISGGLRYEF
jgi:uncharacterized protein YhjY with autotransporter beta-barrel domain